VARFFKDGMKFQFGFQMKKELYYFIIGLQNSASLRLFDHGRGKMLCPCMRAKRYLLQKESRRRTRRRL
jgi:hypothetical protein